MQSTVQESIFSSSVFPGFMGVILFSLISEFYVESLISKQMDTGSIALTGITTSFLVACLLEWYSGVVTTSMLTFLCFFLILWGKLSIINQSIFYLSVYLMSYLILSFFFFFFFFLCFLS